MSVGRILSKVVAVCLIATLALTASAQQVPNLSKKAEVIKRKADSLAPHSRISVITIDGDEEFGEFLSNDQEGFTFQDVDRKTDVTLKYSEVPKLKKGYGGYNSAAGRHTDRTRALVVTAVV